MERPGKAIKMKHAVTQIKNKNNLNARFGFTLKKGGTHTARTMMLDELTKLLSYVQKTKPAKEAYLKAILEDNCLGKRSGKTRSLSVRHLVALYALAPDITMFKALLYFRNRDKKSRPLLALLSTIARDSIFRSSIPFVFSFSEGQIISREALEKHIDNIEPDRFNKTTLKSTAQNINSTWTQSGHLTGRVKKIRSIPQPTAGAVSYALFLSYLTGERCESLFTKKYTKSLGCSFEKAIELAQEASRKELMNLKLLPGRRATTGRLYESLTNILELKDFRFSLWQVFLPCMLYDLTDTFPDWLSAQRYAKSYFQKPHLLPTPLPKYLEYIVQEFKKFLEDRNVTENSVVVIKGVGSLK